MDKLRTCRFCKSENIETLKAIKSPHFPNSYLLYKCNACGSKFFNPNEHDVSLDKMYESFASNANKHRLTDEFKRNRLWDYQKKIINRLLGKEPESILDIGCRTGDFLLHFDNTKIKEGVELSKQYAEVCEKRGIKIHADFVENINFTQQYDVVSCFALLEHVVDPIHIIEDLKKLVKPNGLLIIAIPTHECFKEKLLYKLNIQWHMFSPPEHLNFLSRKQMLNTVTAKNEFDLAREHFTSGGIFNPFRAIPLLKQAFGFFMFQLDKTPLNQLRVFDHMYLFYKKKD